MRRAALRAGAHHVARLVLTERADGDFAVDAPGIAARRAAIAPGPWTWLRQVHGATVVRVAAAGAHAGEEADAAVTDLPGSVLCVQVADCAPLVLVAPGALAVVHAGWRGLKAGVVGAAAAELRAVAAGPDVEAWLGPCIGPECYEFGEADLAALAAELGAGVRGRTRAGAPALDVRAAVRAALERADVELAAVDERCTSCAADTCWSHRARGERQRHTVAAWLEAAT